MERKEEKTGNRGVIERIQYIPFKMELALKYFYKILTAFEPNYRMSKFNEQVVIDIINYVHGSEGNYDNSKAIGFIGSTGSGKTLTMKAMIEYMKIDEVKCFCGARVIPFYPTEMMSIRQYQGMYETNGYDGLEATFRRFNIIVDELGAERGASKHYGNEINIVEAIIEERYSRGNITNFTSNCTEAELEEKYGDRVYSRMKEKTNIIEFLDKDWRLDK